MTTRMLVNQSRGADLMAMVSRTLPGWDSAIHRTQHHIILTVLLAAFTPAAGAADALRWERTETSLALRDGQRVVWHFSAGPEAGKPYLHPVTLPDGTVATDHRPADHKWHLGVWFIFNKLNGVNFWGETEDGRIWGPGRVKVEEIAFEPRDDFSATISIALVYCVGEDRLLVERRRLDIAPAGEHTNTVTFHHHFTAVADIVIDRADYAGIAYRPAPDLMRWRWQVAPAFPGQRPFDFTDRFPEHYAKIKNLVRPPARWMAIVERPEGEARGVAILDHPKNPRYPACWGGLAYNANVWLADEMRLTKGEQLELRYRMVFFDHQVPSSFLEEQHALFSQQP